MPAAKNRRSVDEDPLAKAIAPPPDETPAQREERLVAEKEAKQRSDAIDEELRRSSLDKKNQKPVKVLLLGLSFASKNTSGMLLTYFTRSKRIRYLSFSLPPIACLNCSAGKSTTLKSMSL